MGPLFPFAAQGMDVIANLIGHKHPAGRRHRHCHKPPVRFAPRGMNIDKAVSVLQKNFDLLDTAAGIGGKDGLIGKKDLQAILKNPNVPREVKSAARFLLQNPAYFNQLDVAAGIGQVDGLIGKADVKAYQSQQVRDFFSKNPGIIKTIAQTMQRKNGRRMGQIQKLLGLLDGEFAKLGQAIRAGNKPKIEVCAKKCFGDVAKRSNFDNLDPNMMAEMALREAYRGALEDTKVFAKELKNINGKRDGIRKKLAKAKKSGDEGKVSELEGKLNSQSERGDELTRLLQNAMQKQKQFLTLMSNISKLLHDTAMGIVRKIGQ
jgi:hypothetical protein